MKKILILSMTCGEGHNTVANNLKTELEQEGAEVQIKQIFGYSEKEVIRQNNLFLFACKYFPRIYNKIWNNQRNVDPEKRYHNGMQYSIKKAIPYVLGLINEFQPDAIVNVHFYAGAIVNILKRDNKIDSSIKTFSILTDYCIHPYWESNFLIDYVFTPVDFVHAGFIKKGFSKEQLITTGFPTSSKFSLKISKEEARKNLGLSQNSFVVTIASGGYCLANPVPILKEIKDFPNLEALVICGKNQKRFNEVEKFIKKYDLKNVKNFGFVHNVHEMMKASDCIVSRGGANFITEALHCELPIIFREKCILNEELNAKLLTENGCALRLEKTSEIVAALEIISKEENRNSMIENIKKIKRPSALKDLCNFVMNPKK